MTLVKMAVAVALASLPASANLLVNGNFDADPVTEGNSTCNGASGSTPHFTGWTSFGFGCGTGLHNPDSSQYPGGLAPSEMNVAYHNGDAGFWQAAAEIYQPGVTYTFNILVGQRLDISFAGYTIELRAGTGTGTLLNSTANALSPAPGTFASTSVSYTPGVGDAALGQNVVVVFRGDTLGTQTSFDNAELTASPEPGTYALLGSALVGLVAFRRKQRQQ